MSSFCSRLTCHFLLLGLFLQIASCSSTSVAWRLLHYGDSDINDFKKFPYRKLKAADKPVDFAQSRTHLSDSCCVYNTGKLTLAAYLQKHNTLAFLVIRNDTIRYEHYFDNYGKDSLIQAFSINKSIISLLIGCAIDDGLIGSEKDLVLQYLPELNGRGFDNITIEDLLMMRAPINYTENSNPFGLHARFYYTAKLEPNILKLTARPKGKKKYSYRSAEVALMSLILKRVLHGPTVTSYLQQKVWTPLGMESPAEWTVDIDNDTLGIEKSWCCLATTARDLARIGKLYLDSGMVNGRQIVSKDWIRKSVFNPLKLNADLVYNYNWWVYPKNHVFVAIGKDGQFIYVQPDTKTIVVRLGQNMGKLKRETWFSLFHNLTNGSY
ncbi:MAG: serine hydrolase [Chitinophagales bacterium]